MRKRPRQVDVAAMANVSPAIVSLVINGHVDGNVRISPEAQQRVWAAVRELGYVANPIARKLAGNQNGLLGVFTYEAIFPLEYHDFYYPFLVGIEQEAQAQDHDLLLFTRLGNKCKRAIYKDGVNSLQVADGAILLGIYEEPDEITHLLHDGFPFVYVGKREIPGEKISYVAADYTNATIEVVEYMYRLGHRRIAHLYGKSGPHREAHRDRRSGNFLAHQRLGLPLDERLMFECDADEITAELVKHYETLGVTALLFEDVHHVHAFLDAAAALGKHIPQDISFALLGNPVNQARDIQDVTGFTIPRQEMGQQAVRLLITLLSPSTLPEAQQITLPCTFLPGKTVGPLS